MNSRVGVCVLVSLVLLATPVCAVETLWEDDFQSYDAVQEWYDNTADVDPGGDWVVAEYNLAYVQVHESLVSDPPNPEDYGYAINRGDGDKFLHAIAANLPSIMTVDIPTAAETRMAELGNLEVSLDVYNSVTPEYGGWGGDLEIMGYDNVPETYSPTGFDFQLRADGTVYYYETSWVEIPTLSAVYNPDQWHALSVAVNFVANRYALTIDGTTASGLAFHSSNDLDKIQSVTLYVPGASSIYGRSAFDNVSLTADGESSLLGDLDGDGFVGGADLDIVRSFWGQEVTPGNKLHGDPSGDGFVGGDDLDEVRAHWGEGTPPGPAPVPEPAVWVLVVAGGLWLVVRRATVRKTF